jgi:hypothetical protein
MIPLAKRSARLRSATARGHAKHARQQADQARLFAAQARSAADETRKCSADIAAKLQHLIVLADVLEDEVNNLRAMGRTARSRFR